MKFSDTTTKGGLIQDCEIMLGFADATISGNATLLKQFTTLINKSYKKTVAWIWEVTATWEYDDANQTDLPIATCTIVDEQQDYELPSTAQKIDSVSVLDSNGDYIKLKPRDKSTMGTDPSEHSEEAGMPREYDLVGRSILLYPKPSTNDVTLSKGLKLFFSRDIDEFVSTDTTQEPGFNDSFHPLLSYGACLDYAIAYGMTNKLGYLRAEIKDLKSSLQTFYGSRHRDEPTRIRPRRENII